MMKVTRLLCLVALLVGCASDNEALFEGALSDSCYASRLPFEPDYFAVVNTGSGAFIRMERATRERTRVDGLYLVAGEEATAASATCPDVDTLGAGGSFEVDPAGCIRAYLMFNRECRETFLNAQLRGTLTLERFSFDEGDRVVGTLSGVVIDVQEREAPGGPQVREEPLGSITGRFDFEVEVDESRLRFASPPEHLNR